MLGRLKLFEHFVQFFHDHGIDRDKYGAAYLWWHVLDNLLTLGGRGGISLKVRMIVLTHHNDNATGNDHLNEI